jgi:hypothetical protein
MLNYGCSGLFLNDMGRTALLVVVFGGTVVLATGCSSTGGGVVKNGGSFSPKRGDIGILGLLV